MENIENIIETIGQAKLLCNLCKKELLVKDAMTLSAWTFHPDCYGIVMGRIKGMADVLLSPIADSEQEKR